MKAIRWSASTAHETISGLEFSLPPAPSTDGSCSFSIRLHSVCSCLLTSSNNPCLGNEWRTAGRVLVTSCKVNVKAVSMEALSELEGNAFTTYHAKAFIALLPLRSKPITEPVHHGPICQHARQTISHAFFDLLRCASLLHLPLQAVRRWTSARDPTRMRRVRCQRFESPPFCPHPPPPVVMASS